MAQHNTNISATWDVGVAIKRLSANPLDLSLNHASETELKTYAKENVTAYVGLLVNVVDSNGNLKDSYIIKDKAGNLKKLASDSDLSGLSGVFTFKGIAEAISPDQRIITTRGVTIPAVRNEQGTITKNREPLYCVTTAYEFDMDLYYGWGTSLNDIRFWTDTPTVNKDTLLYGKGEERLVTAYEFNGELYYPIDSTVAPTAGEPVTPYESVGGRIIYITEGGEVHDDDLAAGGPIGEATLITYKGCDFSVILLRITLEENTTSETIIAAPDNSGHVYQIGENEYASNGQIWVKLGSPVEDWIIL